MSYSLLNSSIVNQKIIEPFQSWGDSIKKKASFQGNIVTWVGMGVYSNRFEQFRVEETDKDEVMNLHAITSIRYFPLKEGDTIPLNKGTIEFIINN